MRLICLSRGVHPANGWGRVAYEVLKILAARGVSITVFVPRGSANESIEGVEIRPVLRPKEWGALKPVDAIRDVIAIGRVPPGDVIVAMDEPGVLAAALSSYRSKTPYVALLHGTYAVTTLKGRQGPLHRRAYDRASSALFVSRYTRDRFKDLFPTHRAPLEIMPLGVDGSIVDDDPPDFASRRREILTVGEVKPRKGLLQTIHAVARIPIARRPVILVAGRLPPGSGYVRTAVEMAKNLGVQLDLLNRVSSQDLEQLYGRAAVFVLPSQNVGDHFEGFGLVHLEAAARGLPAIGSRDCGNEDSIVDGVTGHLCKQGDAAELAARIDRLLSDQSYWSKCSSESIRWARSMPWSRTADVLLEAAEAAARRHVRRSSALEKR